MKLLETIYYDMSICRHAELTIYVHGVGNDSIMETPWSFKKKYEFFYCSYILRIHFNPDTTSESFQLAMNGQTSEELLLIDLQHYYNEGIILVNRNINLTELRRIIVSRMHYDQVIGVFHPQFCLPSKKCFFHFCSHCQLEVHSQEHCTVSLTFFHFMYRMNLLEYGFERINFALLKHLQATIFKLKKDTSIRSYFPFHSGIGTTYLVHRYRQRFLNHILYTNCAYDIIGHREPCMLLPISMQLSFLKLARAYHNFILQKRSSP